MLKTSRSLALATAVGLAFAASASADNFSVSGPGGVIPDAIGAVGTWNVNYTGVPFTSTVNVTRNVLSITKVRLSGFNHTWRGDLHIILKSPSASFNVVVRPGFTGLGFGDSGNYGIGLAPGTFDFVESGGGSVLAGVADIPPGTYNQFFNFGGGAWTTGISNTPLSSITGTAGTWTLEIRDWAGGDVGPLTGWTLEGTDASGGPVTTPFCFGDGSSGACPCGNNGSPGNGCANTNNPAGANLASTGNASVSNDTFVMHATGAQPNKLFVFIQSATEIAPVNFGDGRRCLGGNLLRMFLVKLDAASTTASAPSLQSTPVGPPATVSGRSASLGDPLVAGSVRSYQTHYRDNIESFCPSPTGDTFNVTNGLRVTWAP